MGTLIKFVIVTLTDNWIDMFNSKQEALTAWEGMKHKENYGIERWEYPINKEGLAGKPFKTRIKI